jgi:hypothetical protein
MVTGSVSSSVNGEIVELELAERGTRLSNGLWVREVRQLSANGAQSSILSTDMRLDLTRIAASIAARRSQENFLKYMREHYGLDRLIEYGTQPLSETLVVVNPPWRGLTTWCAAPSAATAGVKASGRAALSPVCSNVQRTSFSSVVLQALQSRWAPSTRIGSRPVNVEETVRELA